MVVDPHAAKNQPIQRLGVLFGSIVVRGRVAMVSQYKTVNHLVKNDLATNPHALKPPHAMTGILKRTIGHRRAGPPMSVIKSLSAKNLNLTNGRISVTSLPLRCTDQISKKVAHHSELLCPKSATVEKGMHPRKAVKAH